MPFCIVLADTPQNLWRKKIDRARLSGDSLGGIVAVGATGGSYGSRAKFCLTHKRLDAQISRKFSRYSFRKGSEFRNRRKIRVTGRLESLDKLNALENGKKSNTLPIIAAV